MFRILPALLLLGLMALLFPACSGDDEQPTPQPPVGQKLPSSHFLSQELEFKSAPNPIVPMSAELVFSTVRNCSLTYTIEGGPSKTFFIDNVINEVKVPVLGFFPETENRVFISFTDEDQNYFRDTFTFISPELPAYFPDIQIEVANESAMEPGWTLAGFSYVIDNDFKTVPFIYDNQGNIRWYMKLEFTGTLSFPIELNRAGNIFVPATDRLHEYTLMGERLRSWEFPNYYQHHEIVEKPNGNILMAVSKLNVDTANDFIVELDTASGTMVNEWDLREVLDIDRFNYTEDKWDWLHVNGIAYSESDDCLVISGRNQGVFKVTNNNELVWILAPHVGWGKSGLNEDGIETSDYLLTAVDENGQAFPENIQKGEVVDERFDWAWGQHAPLILPNGNIMVFDNGGRRLYISYPDPYSRAVEYKINEAEMTVEQIWDYGEERADDLYSPIISDVDYHPNTGNYFISSGICGINISDPVFARVVELNQPGNEVVFEAKLVFKNLHSTGPLFWGNFDLVYRSERVELF